MNHERISDEQLATAGSLRKRWRKLSLDDVLFYDGSLKYLVKRLQERYGVDRSEALAQVFEFKNEQSQAPGHTTRMPLHPPHGD